MCEFSGKLIAWLDGELPPNESADFEPHIHCCAECHAQLQTYKSVSDSLKAYSEALYDSAMAKKRSRGSRPVLVLAGAAAVVLFFSVLYTRVHFVGAHELIPAAAQPIAAKGNRAAMASLSQVARAERIHPPRRVHRVQRHDVIRPDETWSPGESSVQIAIPVEDMFPPGAVPEGVSFTADLAIAADGSAQWLRLRP